MSETRASVATMTTPPVVEVAAADIDLNALARGLVRQLIDIGAACQKARSFSVCTESTPLRSVYDVYAEKVEELLKKRLHNVGTKMIAPDNVSGLLEALVQAVAPGAHVAWMTEHLECVDRTGFNWGKFTVKVERERANG